MTGTSNVTKPTKQILDVRDILLHMVEHCIADNLNISIENPSELDTVSFVLSIRKLNPDPCYTFRLTDFLAACKMLEDEGFDVIKDDKFIYGID